MFKVLKYIFLVNLFKKTKFNFIVMGVSFIALFFSIFIMGDIVKVAKGDIYILLSIKWSLILLFLSLIMYNFFKIVFIAFSFLSFKKDTKSQYKKEYILNKEVLLSKSEQILKKYTIK